MRTWTWIIGVVLVVLIAAAAWFVFTGIPGTQPSPNNLYPASNTNPFSGGVTGTGTTTPAVTNTSTDPARFAGDFYRWYLSWKGTGPYGLGDWLTPEFVSNWQSIIDATDDDPVLLAQDTQRSWLTNITALAVSADAASSTVDVSLGSGPDLHSLSVSLVRGSNGWRISAVSFIGDAPATPGR